MNASAEHTENWRQTKNKRKKTQAEMDGTLAGRLEFWLEGMINSLGEDQRRATSTDIRNEKHIEIQTLKMVRRRVKDLK